MNNRNAEHARALRATAAARLSETAMAAAAQLPAARLRAATRGRRPVALARQMAMYLAHVAFDLNLTRVGSCFGRDRTTVRHACARMEDQRDDPRIDLGLAALERGLLARMEQLESKAKEARG